MISISTSLVRDLKGLQGLVLLVMVWERRSRYHAAAKRSGPVLAPSEHNLCHSSLLNSLPTLMTPCVGTTHMTLLSRDLRAEWRAGGVSARDKSRAGGASGTPLW